LIDDLGADSLDWAEMVIETEEEFNITIDEDEFKKLYTIGDIINYLKENGIEDK
jgi:acyl carrier protein